MNKEIFTRRSRWRYLTEKETFSVDNAHGVCPSSKLSLSQRRREREGGGGDYRKSKW